MFCPVLNRHPKYHAISLALLCSNWGEMLSKAGPTARLLLSWTITFWAFQIPGNVITVAGPHSWAAAATKCWRQNTAPPERSRCAYGPILSMHTSQDLNPGVLQTSKPLAAADS